MSFFQKMETKIKTMIKSLSLQAGDQVIENSYGSTILLTSKDQKYAIIDISAGRYDERPDINKDSATISLLENASDDLMKLSNGSYADSNKQGRSFILLNSDKLRINTRNGSIVIDSNDDITIIGRHNMSLKAQKITFECDKFMVNSNDISLGKDAQQAAILGNNLKTSYDSQIHNSPSGPTDKTLIPLPASALSKTVKIK